jgi:hypothetical protein
MHYTAFDTFWGHRNITDCHGNNAILPNFIKLGKRWSPYKVMLGKETSE